MKTINKILLLTDFSDVANNAVDYALQIAKKVKAEIEILHLISTPVDWVKLTLDKEKMFPETKAEIGIANSKLTELLKKFTDQGIKATKTIVYNEGTQNISQFIKEDKYELIVMGSHGYKGIKDFVVGSNVTNVIRNTKIPILVVKKPLKRDSFKRIVMSSTFEEKHKPYFQHMIGYATDLDAKMDLLYINTPYHFKETKEIDEMLLLFDKDCPDNMCNKHHVDAFNEERGIQFFMDKSDADLFAIAPERKSNFSHFFSLSLTEAIIHHLQIPVLIFHV
ncbi:universal stress protein [Marivirga salinae]|uniref:Universal stress protein n=1 Tax=Marivirga salinarum TaxID=3059078 RepID=A0AA49GE81_9BACT|nr:universal stress protein [Marivirga sp. BDSF4-3]WKK77003.2 universal stress protein [Marivirga sp. BDSF4-3]